MALSILDLAPVSMNGSAASALANTLDLAEHVDRLGYERLWLAEHHDMGAIASSSPEILIALIAQRTKRIRVGSGGVMLPNHSSLKVAENFRTLEALYPNRIDLGLGRAPGTNTATSQALRRSKNITGDEFPQQLQELQAFLEDRRPGIIAVPKIETAPQIWLLGSSDFSAQLAAHLGLPFGFAHHFSPGPALDMLRLYRKLFRPSKYLAKPLSMLATNVICADTPERAEELSLSNGLSVLRFRQSGNFAGLYSVAEAKETALAFQEKDFIKNNRDTYFVGTADDVAKRLTSFAEACQVDEIMVSTMLEDHGARIRSYELLKSAMQ